MKKILSIFAVGVLSLSAHTVLADGIGSSVTGSLLFRDFPINFFDPAAGSVPARFGNHKSTKVTIGSGIEFGYEEERICFPWINNLLFIYASLWTGG